MLPTIPLKMSTDRWFPKGETPRYLKINAVTSRVMTPLINTICMVANSLPANLTKIDMKQYESALRAMYKYPIKHELNQGLAWNYSLLSFVPMDDINAECR